MSNAFWDRSAGHISINEGEMPITDIDWNALTERTFRIEDTLQRHMLVGIESREVSYFEFYVIEGSLKLHTDLVLHQGMNTLGVILDAEPDLLLTTGRRDIPAKAGDVFKLDPLKQHGTKTDGFLAFASYDYHAHQLPSPTEFRQMVLEDLRRMLDIYKVGYTASN